MDILPEGDIKKTVERYTKRYELYGYSPKTLGWNKNRQQLRFNALTSLFFLNGKRILDIGCGFGDLNHLLQDRCGDNYYYTGIDLVPSLINEAKNRWAANNIEFFCSDFLQMSLNKKYDIAVTSGIFNHKLEQINNYDFIELVMKQTFRVVREGFAFDFLSDQVDYRKEHTFHSNPGKIICMVNKITRRFIVKNDYLPFEFAVIAFVDSEVNKLSGRYVRDMVFPSIINGKESVDSGRNN